MDKLCRLCGRDYGIKIDIFQHNYVDLIFKFININIKENDLLPTRICHRCAMCITEFYEFTVRSIRVQEYLKRCALSQDITKCKPFNEVFENCESETSSRSYKPGPKGKVTSVENSKSKEEYLFEDDMTLSDKASDEDYGENGNDGHNFNDDESDEYDYGTASGESCHSDRSEEYENSRPKKKLHVKRSDERRVFHSVSNSAKKRKLFTVEESLPKLAVTDNDGIPSHIIQTKIPMAGNIYTCEYCEQTFVNRVTATTHVCSNLLSNTKREEILTCSSNTYTCELCYQVFSRQAVLQAHKAVHMNNSSGEASDDTVYDENFCFFGQKKKKKRRGGRVPRDGVSYKLFFENNDDQM